MIIISERTKMLKLFKMLFLLKLIYLNTFLQDLFFKFKNRLNYSLFICRTLWLRICFRLVVTVVIRQLRKDQNLTIVRQNLTGMTYLQFFGP